MTTALEQIAQVGSVPVVHRTAIGHALCIDCAELAEALGEPTTDEPVYQPVGPDCDWCGESIATEVP